MNASPPNSRGCSLGQPLCRLSGHPPSWKKLRSLDARFWCLTQGVPVPRCWTCFPPQVPIRASIESTRHCSSSGKSRLNHSCAIASFGIRGRGSVNWWSSGSGRPRRGLRMRSSVFDPSRRNRWRILPGRGRLQIRRRRAPKSRLLLVCSSGGHLSHLLALEAWWSARDRFWVTFRTTDAIAALAGEEAYWCFHPTNRNLWNLLRNTILALRICARERPRLIVSSGAAVAVPFFFVGKLFGAHTIYVEVVDRVDRATLTGRLVQPVTDVYAVQWPEQVRFYPRAQVIGRLI